MRDEKFRNHTFIVYSQGESSVIYFVECICTVQIGPLYILQNVIDYGVYPIASINLCLYRTVDSYRFTIRVLE